MDKNIETAPELQVSEWVNAEQPITLKSLMHSARKRVQPKLGVALVAGYGTLNQASATVDKVSILELGAQARYYLLGDFEHGLQVGAEVLYIAASASGSSGSTTATATGEGVSVGPFVGYKFVSSMGFTFDTQLGAARTGLGAKASASTGETASRSETSVGPLLNINLGWTF